MRPDINLPRMRFASQVKQSSLLSQLNEEDYTYAKSILDKVSQPTLALSEKSKYNFKMVSDREEEEL